MPRQNDCIPLVCKPPPEEQLLEAVRANNLDEISSIIDDNPSLLSHRYDHKTILEAVCTDQDLSRVTPETVRLLINLGADLEQPNEVFHNMRVVHFAAESMNAAILAEVLNAMEKRQVNFDLTTLHGNTALLCLLKSDEIENQEQFLKCVQLLSEKVDVNAVNNNGQPAVFIAAVKNKQDVVDILKQHQLDVDSYKDLRTKKTARDLIVEKGWYPSNSFPSYCHSDEELLTCKIDSNTVTVDDISKLEDVNKEYYKGTLLQMLVQSSLVDIVEELMKNYPQLDCNKITNRNTARPIDIALEMGDYAMMAVLLRNIKTALPENLLCQALNNYDREASSSSGKDYKKCAYICLEDSRVQTYLNKPGDRGNYPLHFACRYTDEKMILSLLEKKASLANRSKYDYLTINDMHKRTLETHLDSCLTIHKSQIVNYSDEKEIRFDFTTLIPTVANVSDSKIDIATEKENSGCQEIDNKEPFNCTDRNEMSVPIFMSQSKELKPLLTHPILAMFIYLKWQEVSRIHCFNLSFYITLCIFLYAYVFLNYTNENYKSYGDGVKVLSGIIYVVNIILLAVLILREFFQVWLERWKYIKIWKNIENYMELILIVTSTIIMLGAVLDPSYSLRKTIASIAILFSGIELFLLIGKHPRLSTNTIILRYVSLSFLKLLIWYFILIGAFALSFYTLFSGQKQETGDDPNFFVNPALSAIKTIIMLTGEFDAGNIKFDEMPVISHIIFLMFVFMISIVLFNLMNGLAVTDTQMIKNESELYSYVSQVQYIAYIEKLRTNPKLKKWLKRLFKSSHFKGGGAHIMTVPLQPGSAWVGHFKAEMSDKVKVRQSIVKTAKGIVEERKIEKLSKIERDAERDKLDEMEKMIQEISKKIQTIQEKIKIVE